MVESDGPTRGALELAHSATPATARRVTALARPAGEMAALLLMQVLRSPRARAAMLGLARSLACRLAGRYPSGLTPVEVTTERVMVVRHADTSVLVQRVEMALVVLIQQEPPDR